MKLKLLLAATCSLGLLACTQNERAKAWGGTANVAVPVGQKVVGATWKESQLWYLTRPFRPGETPEVSTLREQSSFGVVEGKVVFTESK